MAIAQCALKIGFAALAFLCLALPTFGQEAQPDGPQRPKLIRKSGEALQESVIKRVEPTYPPLAKAARIGGPVVVEVTIDEGGKVVSTRTVSGHPLLKDAAVAAARQWLFSPTLLQGVPIPAISTITFNFNPPVIAEPDKEIEKLKEQIAANPNSSELYYKLGTVYGSNGHAKEATQAFTQAIQLNPNYAEAHFQLAIYFIDNGQFDKAIDSINLSLARKPGDAEAYKELSRAYLDAGRQEEALGAARQALKLNPSFDQADELYAVVGFVLLRQARYAEAIDALKEGAKLGPDQHHFHLYLGKAYEQAGDRESAMKEYKYLNANKPELAIELMEFLNTQR